jgi:hypothetical protein
VKKQFTAAGCRRRPRVRAIQPGGDLAFVTNGAITLSLQDQADIVVYLKLL